MVVYVLAIRLLGPEQFGKWSLIGSTAELLVIIPLWGLAAASLVYLGQNKHEPRHVVGTAVRVTIGISLLIFPVYMLMGSVVAPLAGLDLSLFSMAVLYTFFMLWSQLSQSFFKGAGRFRILSLFLISSALLFAMITALFLFFFPTPTYESLLWGNIVRAATIALAGVIVFWRNLFSFSHQVARKLVPYGTLSMVSVLLGFFSLSGIDNLMINYYLGVEAVGTYAAYFLVFGLLVGKVLGTASQVFLPLISSLSDITLLFKKSISLLIPSSLLLFVGSFLLIWIAFLFYGDNFEFNPGIALLVAAATTIYFAKSPFESILASRGVPGIKFGPPVAGMLAFLNVVFNLLLIPTWGLHGAALGTGLSVAMTLLFIIYLIKRHFS